MLISLVIYVLNYDSETGSRQLIIERETKTGALGKYVHGKYNKACIPFDVAFALGTQRDQKRGKQYEIYMPNANPTLANPTPPIFHLLMLGIGDGGNANFSVRVGANTNFSVLRYQHVGIFNASLWHWGSKPMQGPKANGFV